MRRAAAALVVVALAVLVVTVWRGWARDAAATPPAPQAVAAAPPGGLSPFARVKAQRLLRERLPCLGCHRLDGEGGAIGPDLSDVAARRSPAYIADMVRDPQARRPGVAMPRVPMSAETETLIAQYLATRGAANTAPEPLRGDLLPLPADGPALYARLCAACHGVAGGGNGANAALLPVRPTAHADSAYMTTRPDDVLYDAIAAGGYVMRRSPRMPPFGATLSALQIRALVRHLRLLCRCEGPAWSRDGDGRPR